MGTPFTLRSARRPSKAGKPEVHFSFVELRPSVCSCLPGKARVHFLSELRFRFTSFPICDAQAEFGNKSSSESLIFVDGRNKNFDNDTQYLQNNLI